MDFFLDLISLDLTGSNGQDKGREVDLMVIPNDSFVWISTLSLLDMKHFHEECGVGCVPLHVLEVQELFTPLCHVL